VGSRTSKRSSTTVLQLDYSATPSVSAVVVIDIRKVARSSTALRSGFLSCLVRLESTQLAVVLAMVLEELLQEFNGRPISWKTAPVDVLVCVADLINVLTEHVTSLLKKNTHTFL
jgi:hypothetical protein